MGLEFSLLTIIVLCFFFGRVARFFHLSEVIGLIIAGLAFSVPIVEEYIVTGHMSYIYSLANLGLVTLMFLAGFEVSGNLLKKERKDAIVITVFTILSSVILGFVVFSLLGYSIEASLVMGVCFSITAEATKARALIQLKKLKTRIGALLMGIGIINDTIGVFLLVVIVYFFKHEINFEEISMLIYVLAAFFAGMFVHYKFDRFSPTVRTIEKILLIVVVPFFFVNMGLNFHLDSLRLKPELVMIVILTATVGQILGVFLTKPVTKLKTKQLLLIGWGMNSKGAVELAIGYIALTIGILPVELYSSLVVTALVSTILFQFIVFYMVKNNPRIMR